MTMKSKILKAIGKGQYDYDYKNDILMFKTKEREYSTSLEFDNLVIDIDIEGYVTGLRVFDATKVFKLTKITLKNVKHFEFHTQVEDKIIKIQLRFDAVLRNKPIIKQGQDFERAALESNINNSELFCTVS